MQVITSLQLLYGTTLFIVGLMMGSFLNVVAFRTPYNISLISPPSTCPQCKTPILARDNIPLVGWLFLKGKCRTCNNPIPMRYPLVELITGILWGIAGYRLATLPYDYWTNVFLGLISLAFVSVMVITFLVDLDFQIILDEISIGGAVVAVVASALLPALHHAYIPLQFAVYHPILSATLPPDSPAWMQSLASSLVGALTGLLFSLAIYYFGNAAFKEQIQAAQKDDPEIDSALGLGDVKLMVFIGALLGWLAVIFTFLIGSSLGAILGGITKIANGSTLGETGWEGLKNRWSTGNSVIPFGPFLVTAALAYHFLEDPIRALMRDFFLF